MDLLIAEGINSPSVRDVRYERQGRGCSGRTGRVFDPIIDEGVPRSDQDGRSRVGGQGQNPHCPDEVPDHSVFAVGGSRVWPPDTRPGRSSTQPKPDVPRKRRSILLNG